MTRWAWRTLAPWLTPALVVVEVGLVWSGLLPLRAAIVAGVVIEALLWATVLGRVLAGVRSFRGGRARGVDVWTAAEDGLAQLVPRRLARILLIEPRLWICLARWVTGRHDGARGFGYHDCVRVGVWVAVGLIVVEGAMVDLVLALALPGSPWALVSTGLHAYGLVLMLGFYASLVTRPHVLESEALRLRESVLTEVIVPYRAIARVSATTHLEYARSWFKVDAGRRVATLAYGDANVALALDPDLPILINGRPCEARPTTLYATVDDARGFLNAVADARQVEGQPGAR